MVNSGVYPIQGYPQFYSWGDRASIPEFLGDVPTGQPFAELWFGTHERGASVTDGGIPLKHLVSSCSDDEGLPFLLKYIAPAKPLSLQVHPSQADATRGFDAENTRGIALDAPDRSFRDGNHKPELLYALTSWRALVGFAPISEVTPFFQALGDIGGGPLVQFLEQRRLEDYLRYVLTETTDSMLARFSARCDELREHDDFRIRRRAELACLLNGYFPRSAGVLVAMVMNDVTLRPGNALFVPVGTIHAYVSGFGVEVMTCSDNVIRAGLTEKHIDINELIACTTFDSDRPELLTPQVKEASRVTLRSYRPAVEEFQVDVVDMDNGEWIMSPQPNLLATCIAGSARIGHIPLRRGQTVFVNCGNSTKVDGSGTLLFVTRRGNSLMN